MAENLEIISVTPSLALEVKLNQIREKIVKRLADLKLTDTKYKTSNDVILLICNLVEHLVKENKDKKINKKTLVCDIMQSVYSLNAQDRVIIENAIEFLHSNRAIKKLSRFYLFCVGVFEYFTKSKKKG